MLVDHVQHRTSRARSEAIASLCAVEDACDRALAALPEEVTESAETIVGVREWIAALRAATAGEGDARRPEWLRFERVVADAVGNELWVPLG